MELKLFLFFYNDRIGSIKDAYHFRFLNCCKQTIEKAQVYKLSYLILLFTYTFI